MPKPHLLLFIGHIDLRQRFKSIRTMNDAGVFIYTSNAIKLSEYVLQLATTMNKKELIVFEEQASLQQQVVTGDATRLQHEVGFIPRDSLHEAFTEVLQS